MKFDYAISLIKEGIENEKYNIRGYTRFYVPSKKRYVKATKFGYKFPSVVKEHKDAIKELRQAIKILESEGNDN